MTNQEAINVLQELIYILDDDQYNDDIEEAFNMAVMALRETDNDR